MLLVSYKVNVIQVSEVKYAAHKMIIVTFQLQLLLPQIFLSYLQTNATTSNIVGPIMPSYCIHLHKAKSLTSFKLCATTSNNTQQHATGCANRCNMSHPTMLVDVAQCFPTLIYMYW